MGILAGVCACFGAVWGILWGKVWVVGGGAAAGRDPGAGGADVEGLRREGAQGRAGMRSSGGGGGGGAAAAASAGGGGAARDSVHNSPIRPPHTRSVSGVTAVNDDDQDLEMEMGPDLDGRSGAAGGVHDVVHHHHHHHHHSPHGPPTPVSPVSPTNTTRRGGGGGAGAGAGAGEVIELDPVTSEFMRETALGRVKK